MSMKICFLTHPAALGDEGSNVNILSQAARALDHEVGVELIDDLSLSLPQSRFDLVWVLSLGSRQRFLPTIQLLQLLAQRTRVVNTPEALMFLHSKLSLSGWRGQLRYPETYFPADAAFAAQGEWIVKPLAESFGHGVRKLSSPKAVQIATAEELLLQRYVPEAAAGEKRVLLAGGEVVGWYGRQAKAGEIAANLHQGGEAFACELTPQERSACEEVGAWLLARGAHFAGLDIAGEWLLEWNVVSPGGLGTLARLSGKNLANDVISKVLASSQKQKPAL